MTAAGRATTARPSAMPMLAKVQIARKELGLDDDTYRAVLERLTGQRSAKGLSDAKLAIVLDEFKAKGWKPKVVAGAAPASAPKSGRRPADHPVARKARAMWISLHQLGVVQDPSESALEAFAKRQLKVDALQWADQRQGFRLIEALKAWAEREGWSQEGSTDEIKDRLARLIEARARG